MNSKLSNLNKKLRYLKKFTKKYRGLLKEVSDLQKDYNRCCVNSVVLNNLTEDFEMIATVVDNLRYNEEII